MSSAEIDAISVQRDPHSLVSTHMNNYCRRLKLFYLTDGFRPGAVDTGILS